MYTEDIIIKEYNKLNNKLKELLNSYYKDIYNKNKDRFKRIDRIVTSLAKEINLYNKIIEEVAKYYKLIFRNSVRRVTKLDKLYSIDRNIYFYLNSKGYLGIKYNYYANTTDLRIEKALDYIRVYKLDNIDKYMTNRFSKDNYKLFYDVIKNFIVMYESSVIDSVKILEESNNHSLKRVKSAIEIHSRFSYLSISSDYSTQHFYYDMLIKYSGLEKLMTAILGKDDSLKWKAIISLASDTFITDAESLLGRLQSINKNNKRVLAKLNDRFGNYLLAEEI